MSKNPASAKDRKGLTPKQRKFCDIYLALGDAGEAARRAGYDQKGPKAVVGQGVLRGKNVQRYIAEKQRKFAERYDVTADRVMAELARTAFADPGAILRNEFKVENYTEDELAALDVEISAGPQGKTKKIKMQDKIGALEKLAKILRLYPDKNVNVLNAQVIPGMRDLLERIDGKDTGIGAASGRTSVPALGGPEVAVRKPVLDQG